MRVSRQGAAARTAFGACRVAAFQGRAVKRLRPGPALACTLFFIAAALAAQETEAENDYQRAGLPICGM
jgi:hypothetical protein